MQQPTNESPKASRDPENLIGKDIAGRFTVLECIGKGGMGVVYTATQHALERDVVLKVVRTEDAAPEAKDRFRREAVVLSRLSHPNVVQIYDHGRDADTDLWFIAMEYVRGITLSRYLKQRGGVLPVNDFRVIATQILQGAAEAHRLGLVHRDLKPANIMLTSTRGERIQVKILDFGLSKLVKEAEPLTQGHQMLGSAMYMAPEQLRGQKVTTRADVYALGVIFYQLLSGKKPIEGPDSIQVIAQQLAGGTRSFRDALGPATEVPEDLISLVERCLAVEPKDRPRDAVELLSLMEHGLAPVTQISADTPILTAAMMGNDGPTDSTMRTGPTDITRSETHARVGMYAGLAGGGVALLVAIVLGVLVVLLLLKDTFRGEPAVAAIDAATQQAGESGLDEASRILRERGLTAMRDGDYDRAVNMITEAVMMAPGEADLKELLTIAIDLRDNASTKAAATDAAEAKAAAQEEEDAVAEAAAAAPSPSPRRAAPRPSPRPRSSPKPTPPPVGMAVITSIPKARVEVAGHGGGSTPFRAEDLPVGTHEVSFFVDGAKVHSTTIKVGSDSVELMDVDLAPYLKPEPKPEPKPTPAPIPAPIPAPAAAPEPTPAPGAATAEAEPAEATGELFVSSPNIFGNIWINGKNHGPTPIVAKNLPVGPVTIEVRVGKNVRRTENAVVTADTRKKITIR